MYFLSAISFRIRTYGDSTYVRTYFLSAISFHIRTYGDSIYVQTPTPHPYYDSVPLHKHQLFHWGFAVIGGFQLLEQMLVSSPAKKYLYTDSVTEILRRRSCDGDRATFSTETHTVTPIKTRFFTHTVTLSKRAFLELLGISS